MTKPPTKTQVLQRELDACSRKLSHLLKAGYRPDAKERVAAFKAYNEAFDQLRAHLG